MKTWKIIGAMSGTSLDGLDLALCQFWKQEKWSFKILKAETIPYTNDFARSLSELNNADAFNYVKADKAMGYFIADKINNFIKSTGFVPDLIASHGHTVFHQPKDGITAQIGDGNVIAAATRLPVVYNFRVLDVALGGQGAPLVPVGDRYLFGEYDYCLNIGGIANISCERDKQRIAWDICPANQVLNYLSMQVGKPYDAGGKLAATGSVEHSLLSQLDKWFYYSKPYPKSLGREDVENHILPLFDASNASIQNKLTTYVEHMAVQIGRAIMGYSKRILITGGGTYNDHLMGRIQHYCDASIVIPSPEVIEFKEALIFAFLGLLRYQNQVNCFASVTGASTDSICGVLIQP